jgi:TetR/AcrR family transcriptional repressor of nem operon
VAGNKEKVLVAAAELFHLNGFQATGLEEILSQSGVCKSNFYYHFKSKDDLGLQVIERQMEDLIETLIVPTLDAAKLDVYERLELFFTRMIDYCGKYDFRRGCLFGNLALELGERHESMRAKVSDFFLYTEKRIAAVLAEAVKSEQLSLNGLAPEEAATSIVSLLQGSILLAKGHHNSDAMHHSLKMMLHFLGDNGRRSDFSIAGSAR